MRGENLKIRPILLKLEEDKAIVEEDEVVLSLRAHTYGLPLIIAGQERGVVFYGEGDFLVNSEIETHVGAYSKQYVDRIRNFGVIIGGPEKWELARQEFVETKDVPENFEDQRAFIEKAKDEVADFLDRHDFSGIRGADWFFEVEGEKEGATLYYNRGRIVFRGCKARLVHKSRTEVVLREAGTKLVLRGDNIVLKSGLGRLIASGERIVSRKGVVSRDKVVTRAFMGKNEDLAGEIRVEALSTLPKALEEIGYAREA